MVRGERGVVLGCGCCVCLCGWGVCSDLSYGYICKISWSSLVRHFRGLWGVCCVGV